MTELWAWMRSPCMVRLKGKRLRFIGGADRSQKDLHKHRHGSCLEWWKSIRKHKRQVGILQRQVSELQGQGHRGHTNILLGRVRAHVTSDDAEQNHRNVSCQRGPLEELDWSGLWFAVALWSFQCLSIWSRDHSSRPCKWVDASKC